MKKTFLTLIAALMVCVAFAQEQQVKPVSQKNAEQPKEIIEFWQHIFLDEGCAVIRASRDVQSLLQIVVEVEDANGKLYRQGIRMYEGMQETFVYPKYGADIRWVEIISITPDEDAYCYYRF